MKVALYARVSTDDKDQDPETQLIGLRDFCRARGWEVYREYVDRASALGLRRRTAWRELLDEALRRRFASIVAWKLDRAFRSVKEMHDTFAVWESAGVSFVSMTESWDTSTPIGRLVRNVLGDLAEFELGILRERVRAGMERARRQGHRIGRPGVSDRQGFERRYGAVLERLGAGEVSRREAATELGIGYATLKRLLDVRTGERAGKVA